LAQLRESTLKRIEHIERQTRFDPHKTPLCDWCEYKPECPAWSRPNQAPASSAEAD